MCGPGLIPAIESDLRPQFDDVEYFIEKGENLSRPDISLEDIARSADPAGLLARRLLILERRDPPEHYRRFVQESRRQTEESRSSPQFSPLPGRGEPAREEEVRDLLIKAALRILVELLAQKEAGK